MPICCETLYHYEFSILDWIQKIRSPLLDPIMIGLSKAGDIGLIWILLAIGLLIWHKDKKLAWSMGLALCLSLLVVNLGLKPLLNRLRPFEYGALYHYNIPVIPIKLPHDPSFPSGHSSASFAAASSLWANKSKLAKPCLLLADLIAFSRLYLYVHFPSDVVCGILIGLLSGFTAGRIVNSLASKHAANKLNSRT